MRRASLEAVGGGRFGGRLLEARKLGFKIETKYAGPASEYMLLEEPTGDFYDTFSCSCGWRGSDTAANHGHAGALCPKCGQELEAEVESIQVALL